MVHCCNAENAVNFAFPRGVAERSIDGLIISNSLSGNKLELFEELNIPCVRVGFINRKDSSRFPAFGSDMLRGRMLALEYLAQLGHKDVVFLNTGAEHTRYVAGQFEEDFRRSALADRMKIHSVFTPDGKCDASSASIFFSNYYNFPEKQRPSAVITNPQTCLGILKEMGKYGINCPKDLSLISNYNYEAFDFISPGITSLKYDNAEIGAYAAERLLEIIDSDTVRNISQPEFPVTLEIRQSCAQYVKTKQVRH
jgi:LacI family sucrose operon transcriptional repressor